MLEFYAYLHKVDCLPVCSHLANCRMVGKKYWTQRPYCMTVGQETEGPLPGYITYNNLGGRTGLVDKATSDNLVHLDQQVAAAAWLITRNGPSIHGVLFDDGSEYGVNVPVRVGVCV